MEESKVQWSPPAWINGMATPWRDATVLLSNHYLWYSPIHKTKDAKVIVVTKYHWTSQYYQLSLTSQLYIWYSWLYKLVRFGPIFKTSLVGQPVIVSTDADLNYFIFQQEGQLFKSWYPDTFTEVFGRQNVGSLHGFMHKYLKNMVLTLFGPESLKKMLPEVEEASNQNLKMWSRSTNVDVKEGIAQAIRSYLSASLNSAMLTPHITFSVDVFLRRWYSVSQPKS